MHVSLNNEVMWSLVRVSPRHSVMINFWEELVACARLFISFFLAQFNLDDGGEVKMEKKDSFFFVCGIKFSGFLTIIHRLLFLSFYATIVFYGRHFLLNTFLHSKEVQLSEKQCVVECKGPSIVANRWIFLRTMVGSCNKLAVGWWRLMKWGKPL